MSQSSTPPASWRKLRAELGRSEPRRGPALPNSALPRSGLSDREKLGLLAGFILLALFRLPQATWNGRLLGEEGQIFLAYAWHRDAWDALWRSFGGYLNLSANASTLLAARLVQYAILPLELVPRLTMGIATVFQALPAAIILWGRSRWLTDRWAYVATLLMIALAPFSEEVWLNVLHIQFHLALCCALILVLEPPATPTGWIGQGAILLLAPLSGPGALVLSPLFLARAFFDRSSDRLVQTMLLGLGCLAQMLFFFTPSPVRGQLIDLPSLATIIFVRLGALPVSGILNGQLTGLYAFHAHEHQGLAWWLFSGLSIAYCAGLAAAAWVFRRHAAGWLIAAGLALAVASFGGGMIALTPGGWFSPTVSERYNFLPLALLGIAVVAVAQDGGARSSLVAKILCGVMILTGLIGYFVPIEEVSQGPDWRSQVRLWHDDHNYALKGWPAKWTIDLSDVDRPCPEARLGTATALDPGYCESGWLDKARPDVPANRDANVP